MSRQTRFPWEEKPKSDQSEESGAARLDPQTRALVLALMVRVLVAVVRVPKTGCPAMQEEVSDER